MLRFVRTLCGCAIPALAVACGPPVLYDTSHQPVLNPLVTASVDHGWLAVDSTANGVRVVVEMRLQGPPETSDVVGLHLLKLHCAVSGEHIPAKVLREEPRCPTPSMSPIRCPERSSPEECDRLRQEFGEQCQFTIRAEYLFDQMPHLNENSHFFTFGQIDQPIRWAKVPGTD